MKLEVCVEARGPAVTAAQVVAARAGGAATIELCREMAEAGLTPTEEDIRAARAALRAWRGLLVMIRPRPGGFVCSESERALMARQIDAAAEAGADGVVLGAVRADGAELDRAGLAPLVDQARGRGLLTTLHRAFDATADRAAALEAAVALGFDRLLTSGVRWGQPQPGTAVDGLDAIERTLRDARGRVEVVVAGGVDPHTLPTIMGRLAAGPRGDPGLTPGASTPGGGWSLHCHRASLRGGVVDRDRVRSLVRALAGPP